MKTERKTAPAALRRGMVFLCTLVLTLMAVTLPASAALTTDSLTNRNIGLKETENYGGDQAYTLAGGSVTNQPEYSWDAKSTTINGSVMPTEQKAFIIRYGWGRQCYKSACSTLIITNNSDKRCLLTFSYTNPRNGGTLSFDPASDASSGLYQKELAPRASVSVKLTTTGSTEAQKTKNSIQHLYAATTTLSNISMKPLDENVSVTLAPASNGSYTAKIGGTALEVGKTYSKPATTEYTFTCGAAAPNYVFDGWYINGNLDSRERTYTCKFAADSTVEARFVDDPLLSIIQLGEGAAGDKTDYVAVNSDYYHNVKGSYHTNVGDTNANNSYGDHTYFPDTRWSLNGNSITSHTDYTEHGAATGDSQTQLGFSQAVATLYSDIIRVKCKENCIITFDSNMNAQSVDISNPSEKGVSYGVFLYYYTTASASANAGTIKANGTAEFKGSKQTSGSASTRVVVNKGEYLYLYAYAQTRKDKQFSGLLGDVGYSTDNYTYTATISNFTVTPNTTEHTFTTGNRDNTGAVLKSGSVKINGTAQGVSSGTYSYKAADNATLTLTPGTAPTGYAFIGWHNITDNVYDYTNSTYRVKMTKDYEVTPIYVPAMIITAGGANGYGSADYQYKDLNGKMVKPTDQYVARGPIPNSGTPNFYKDLNTAFTKESTVFLLAGDTFNGSLTIPTGKTLVIPDRLADSGPAASQPEQVTTSAGISSYCKVALNGNLTVDGKLVVNGMQSSTANGRAAGSIGYLSLSNDATITVSSGGELCGYGQIRGGSISAENGSTVRELMEISDRRAALVMQKIDAEKSSMRVFPFSNFSIKTIESPVTYASGAKLYAQYSIMLEGNNQSTGAVLIFGPSGALFNLTQGSMTKSFDLAADKTVYRLNEGGKMSTGSFQLDVKFSAMGMSKDITIKSQEYWMPLNAGFDLRTAGDMTVNSDFKFLPGASLSVEKGGTCTIASSAKLLFYRLNDYDTREIGSGTYQKGYSLKAYPVNATNLPGGGYTHPKLDTVGSARLNVDGEMIVNGGLYVSDELVSQSNQGFTGTEPVDGVNKTRQEINQAYFKLYPNGYNVLTGTGSINMTTALTNSNVNEAMTSQNTNDPAWAKIPISPIKGLKADATADTPENYQSLNTQATYYGVYRPGNFYVWTTEKPEIAKIVGGGNDGTIYRSLAAAVQAYTAGTGYIQMLKDSTEPGFTVSQNVTLDLNGKTVTLASPLTVAEGFTLSGMDSSTGKSYDVAPSGKIVGKVTGCAPTYQTPPTVDGEYDRYVAILSEENGTSTLSFHHFNISVTGYRFELAAPQCALIFRGEFRGDDEAKKHLKSLGFTLTYENDTPPDTVSYQIPKDIPPMPADGKESTSEVVRDTAGAYLFEACLMCDINKENYRTPFTATAQATFDNGGKQSDPRSLSFKDALKNPGTISGDQKTILDNFLNQLGITNP